MAKRLRLHYIPEDNIVDPNHRILFKNIQPNNSFWYRFIKRSFDIVGSLIGLVVLSPMLLIVALAVKSDGGSVFFMQRRVGKDGHEFLMYKFRSMVPDAEKILAELQVLNDTDGPVFKLYDDPRITPIGRFIRKYSIDELPQLINILRGDMSVVGPRPPLPREVEQYTDYDRQRLLVRPGLTCYWQCGGRSRIKFEKWIDMDLEYIYNQNLWCDFKIILKTIPAVLLAEGAY